MGVGCAFVRQCCLSCSKAYKCTLHYQHEEEGRHGSCRVCTTIARRFLSRNTQQQRSRASPTNGVVPSQPAHLTLTCSSLPSLLAVASCCSHSSRRCSSSSIMPDRFRMRSSASARAACTAPMHQAQGKHPVIVVCDAVIDTPSSLFMWANTGVRKPTLNTYTLPHPVSHARNAP